MDTRDDWHDDFEIELEPRDDAEPKAGRKPATRMEALRKKLKSLRGRDPDIYPMW